MTKIRLEYGASPIDLAQLTGPTDTWTWRLKCDTLRPSITWRILNDRTLLGLVGLYPLGLGEFEGWFVSSPAMAAHMPAVIKACRLTLKTLPYRKIMTCCRTREGEIIARRLGFSFLQSAPMGEIYIWQQ